MDAHAEGQARLRARACAAPARARVSFTIARAARVQGGNKNIFCSWRVGPQTSSGIRSALSSVLGNLGPPTAAFLWPPSLRLESTTLARTTDMFATPRSSTFRVGVTALIASSAPDPVCCSTLEIRAGLVLR